MSPSVRLSSILLQLRGIWKHRPERWTVSEWNRAYSSGQLAYFGEIDELARYSILTGYLRRLDVLPDIIDVGCGNGLLRRHLKDIPFASYLGIDLSDVAVNQAAIFTDDHTTFRCADFMTCDLPMVDVVVLNEVLYFTSDPEALLDRIAAVLRSDGRLLVSMWRHPGDRHLWAGIGRRFQLEDEVTLSNPASKLAPRGWHLASYQLPPSGRVAQQ